MPLRWPVLVALLLGLCLTLAPSRYLPGDPNAALASTAGVHFDETPGGATGPKDLATLARTDAVAALEACLRRYQDEVEGYTCTLAKHERINGKLRDPEVIRCAFRERPFSVFMHWVEGKDQAEKTLYVQGDHGGRVLVVPARFLARNALRALGKTYADLSPNDPQVRGSSRYSVHEFGIARGMERTYLAWKAAREKGTLRVEYRGLQPVSEAGGRPCHILVRTCDPPEEEGLTELTIALDDELWLQVGSVLKAGDDLIGSYHFRDIAINPKFPTDQFTPEAFRR